MKYDKSQDYLDKERQADEISKDIATARSIITDGIVRYKKKMLRARNKKQAEDLSVFDELNEYNSREDIHDAYGWDIITEAQMDRLTEMWDAREKLINKQGQFENRVTSILEHAILLAVEPYLQILEEFDEMKEKREKEIREIEERNAAVDYERYIAGL